MCHKLQPLFSFDFLILHNDIVFIKWIKYQKNMIHLLQEVTHLGVVWFGLLVVCLSTVYGFTFASEAGPHMFGQCYTKGLWLLSRQRSLTVHPKYNRGVGFVVLSEEPPCLIDTCDKQAIFLAFSSPPLSQ